MKYSRYQIYGTQDWFQLAHVARYKVKALSQLTGHSVRQLERYFRSTFGESPHQWLTERRMSEAEKRLAHGDAVKTVAIELGFKQVSNFCRQFKAHHGVTALEFLYAQPSKDKPTSVFSKAKSPLGNTRRV